MMLPPKASVFAELRALDGERGRCLRHLLRNHVGIEPHHRRVVVGARPGARVQRPRLRAEHLHADVAQHPQRCLVDGLDLIVAENPDRWMRVAYGAPWQALDCGRSITAFAPVSAGASSSGSGHRVAGFRAGSPKQTIAPRACQAAGSRSTGVRRPPSKAGASLTLSSTMHMKYMFVMPRPPCKRHPHRNRRGSAQAPPTDCPAGAGIPRLPADTAEAR